MYEAFYISKSQSPVIAPQKGCPWADKMVLNPAIIQDPYSSRLHMLFRACGPWSQARMPGKAMPYPIFLGYAWSDDNGEVWHPDFSKPALAPALQTEKEKTTIADDRGKYSVDYTNGCVEDPRLFYLDGSLYLTVAGRVFPPGPYWEHIDLKQPPPDASPMWRYQQDCERGIKENLTVSVLYRVDLSALKDGSYNKAFQFVTTLTNPACGDNRDVFLFPEKLLIDGRKQYVAVHRPSEPMNAQCSHHNIMLAVADDLYGFTHETTQHRVLAQPLFDWEQERIGGSCPPIKIDNGQWLLPYHGKKDNHTGYTQSFMILAQNPATGWPEIIHRCSVRLVKADQKWEMSKLLYCPCIFTCSAVVVGKQLIMGYGAGDEKIGIARCDFFELLNYIRKFDAKGRWVQHLDVSKIKTGKNQSKVLLEIE